MQLALIWGAILAKGSAVKRVQFGAGVELQIKELVPALKIKERG